MLPIKLLLIDDNEDNRTLIKIALQRTTNWKILTTCDAISGISKAETERPDVILLDLVMPDLDGLTTYDILKNNLFTCTIPIIFITAMVNRRVLTELEGTRATGIITKPFDAVRLASNISKMCGWDEIFFEENNRLKNWQSLEREKKSHNFRLVPYLSD